MWFDYFQRGGPIMWPLLVCSVIALAVVLERVWFLIRERAERHPQEVEQFFTLAEGGHWEEAARPAGKAGYILRTLRAALTHPQESASQALLRASSAELRRYNRGLSLLDTIITLSPLLGLLGTVTGMIRAFGFVKGELDAPAAITGGIAEALIATAFGLAVAIIALIPFNYLNTRLEEARHDLQDACTRLEMLLQANPSSEETWRN